MNSDWHQLTAEERQLLEAEHPPWSHEDKGNDENYTYPCLVQRALLTIDRLAEVLETTLALLNEMHVHTQGHTPEYCDMRTDFCVVSRTVAGIIHAHLSPR